VSNFIRPESIAAHLVETHAENAERIVQGLIEGYQAAGNETALRKWREVSAAIQHLRSQAESDQPVRKYREEKAPATALAESMGAEENAETREAGKRREGGKPSPEGPLGAAPGAASPADAPESPAAEAARKDEERMILEFQAIELRRMRDELDFLRRQNERLIKLVEHGRSQ